MIDGEKQIPRELAQRHAASDPTLADMLRKGVPLSRNAYLTMAYGGDVPEEWNAEHEMDVPECFRDPNATRRDPRKKGGGNVAQD